MTESLGFFRRLPLLRRGRSPLRLFQILALAMTALGLLTPLVLSGLWTEGGTGFSICVFFNLTGVPCPGCGLTRSVSATLHGQLLSAARFHLFGPLVAVGAVLVAASGFIVPLSAWIEEHSQRIVRWILIAAVVVLLLGIGRGVLVVVDPGLKSAPGRLIHPYFKRAD